MTDKQCKGDERCEDFECKKPGKTTVLANPNYFRISESVCPCERGERGLLESILAWYKPLASQNPHSSLESSLGKFNSGYSNLVTFCICIYFMEPF